MPISKKRKKKNGVAKFNRNKSRRQIEENSYAGDLTSGVSLQDLIDMVAYQEYQQAGIIEGPAIPDISTKSNVDFGDPDTQAVIQAVHEASTYSKENEDGK